MGYFRERKRSRRFWVVSAAVGPAVVSLSVGVALFGGVQANAAGGTWHPAAGAKSGTAGLVATSPLQLHRVGTVDLAHPQKSTSSFHAPVAAAPVRTGAAMSSERHAVPLKLYHALPGTAAFRAAKTAPLSALPHSSVSSVSGNTTTHSFDGINALMNSSSNSPYLGAIGDLTPPDQGLAAGRGKSGTAIVELVNDTFDVYSTSGKPLTQALPAFQVFQQPPSTFLSDPRVYWDAASGHWFLTMFAFPALGGSGTDQYGCVNGGAVANNCQTAQFIAVSATSNPLGKYTVFWFDTTDGTNTSGTGGHIGDGCGCFGDFDQVGSDSNGFYITTNEFCVSGNTACNTSVTGGFNGTVIYAFSKSALLTAAETNGPLPAIQRYGVNSLDDPFAAYHLSPSTATQGSTADNTEYFVESNANLPGDPTVETSGLEVFALLGTSALKSGGTPSFVNTNVSTENYTAVPPVAVQESGSIPFGNLVGRGVTPGLLTDFNAVQQTTYANGLLYTELNTGLALGMQENAGAAWFVLKPTPSASSVSATNAANGYVETTQDILYPAISVNAKGQGYMAFALAGPAMYPSPAYVAFNGTKGAASVVHLAASGATPLDDFSCYGGGGCRYGDYSMAQEYNGTTYMATEYVPGGTRDTFANWGTRIYSATDGKK